MGDAERLDEIRRGGHDRFVEAVETDLLGVGGDAAMFEDIRKADAAPTGIAHRAVAHLAAGNARSEETAAVAGTLVDRNDFNLLELRFQFGEGKLDGLADGTFDFEAERFDIDRRRRNNREMVTHEEGVVGSEDALVENGKGSLDLRWPARVADQQAFLRVSDERTFAVFKWERYGVIGASIETKPSPDKPTRPVV